MITAHRGFVYLIFAAYWIAAALLSISSAHAAGRQTLRGHVPDAVSASRDVGPVARSTRMTVAVGLPLRNSPELDELLKQLVDPASPNYRQYLTSAQFAERFGPTEEDYQILADFMRANGFEVTGTHPNRMILDVSGPVATIERTFHVNMTNWEHATRGIFFAPDREPTVDAGVTILDITGLDNFVVPHPMDLQSLSLNGAMPLTTGSGPAGLFIGKDFRAAYAPNVTLNGTGQSVGLFELDGFYAPDVQSNFKQAGLPPVPVQTVLLDGDNGTPGSANIEVILDIMMAAYMAPGASSIIVYEGYNWNDVLNRMATDNLAAQLSSSWCFSPTNATTEQIFKQMIAQGQSLFQASGDSGSYTGWIMPPADDPNVTVVGGTSLTTAVAGGAWQSETTWSGSGGGVSTTWPIPSYQKTVNMAAIGGSTTMRNIPDVALTADIQMYLICNNGQAVSVGGTSAAAPLWAGFMALANQQAASGGKARVGFMNPLIYAIGAGSNLHADLHDIVTGNNKGYSAVAGFDLATGWGTPAGQSLINDLSGVGSAPSFGLSASPSTLSIAVATNSTSTITINAQGGFKSAVNLTVSGLPTGVTASFSPASASTTSTLTLTASSSATQGAATLTITGTSGTVTSTTRVALTVNGPPSFTIVPSASTASLAQGTTSTSTTLMVAPQNGFNANVALTISGLPTGVTSSFSPASTNSGSTLTLTATSSAKLGAATITITGTSGSLHSAATIALTVTGPPAFTLSASPTALTVAPGASNTSTITVTPQNGFKAAVTLAATGLPSGVTAAFAASSTNAGGTLTLTASSSVTPGTSTITITGTSGSLHSTTIVNLTVAAVSSFTITASPATLTVGQGGTGVSAITVVPMNGFNSNVTLAVTGLPTGITAAFSPVSTTKTSTLTFTAASNAVLGASTVTVTGTAGTTVSRANIALTVVPPASFQLAVGTSSINFSAGGSSGATLNVMPFNGFTGTVSFTVSGLPAGVTATFNPASTTKSTTLTFTAATNAPPGTSTVNITGTSGTLIGRATIAVTVVGAPSFTVSATPASLSLNQGGTVSSMIAVSGQNGFGGTVGFTISGLPTGVTSAFAPSTTNQKTTLTLTATSAAAPGAATPSITATSGTLSSKIALALTVTPPPSFTLSAIPPVLNILPGVSAGTSIAVNPVYGFSGSVALTASGLPTGVTAAFTPSTATGVNVVSFTASGAVTAGTSTVTITGKSGSLTRTVPVTLTVLPLPSGSALVNMSSVYNVAGRATDASTFTNGGLDAGGRSYSATLLAAVQNVGGTMFALGPPDASGAVSSATVPLPAGQYGTLKLLATAVNGNQTSQTFTVTYTDGATSTFTQSMSDWCTPQNYTGESQAITMTYRDNSDGTRDIRSLTLYGYTFNLASGKTVKSIALPKTRNVVVLGMSLSGTANAATAQQVSLASLFNTTGITTDGKTFTGGLDGVGFAYSGNLLGKTQTGNKTVFNFGAADAPNVVSCTGKAVTLPPGSFSSLQMLATGANGNQLSQTFKVTYTDGTSTTFTQGLSDWLAPQSFAGESAAIKMAYRNDGYGAKDNRVFTLYQYSFALNNSKTVSTITLPNTANVKVLAITLVP